MTDRVVVLIDMDCFYCQVETRLNPALRGIPMAVVQYNQWKGGGIIAVNYEARDRGVTRHMRGAEAKKHCPEIVLVTVPTIRDKADLTRYRDAGREVISVFCQFTSAVQRASVDEAYIDLTSLVNERIKSLSHFDSSKWKSTYVVGYTADGCNDEEQRQRGMKSWLEDCESIHNTPSLHLAVGALIVEEMREAVFAETGFRCSAGIAHNKILAKLACGLHKPNRQTVLPQESVDALYKTLPVKKIRNLGGKFGDDVVEKLGCRTMSELSKFSEKDLQNRYDEKTGTWLYNIARGYDYEPVTARLISKSIGCCKKFPGKTALKTSKDVYHWLNKLAEELSERLLEDEAMNKRRATLLTVSMALEINRVDTACSKSVSLSSNNIDKIFNQAEALLKKTCKIDPVTDAWSPPIKYLGLSAGKFSDVSNNKIDRFFKATQQSSIKNVCSESIVNEDLKEAEEENERKTKESSLEPTARPSFFEKKFAKDIQNSGKKLHIVPDLTKNDLFSDSDESQSSLIKLRNLNTEVDQETATLRDTIKKNLFDANTNDLRPCQEEPRLNLESGTNSVKKVALRSKEETKLTEEKNKRKSNETNKSIASFFNQSSKTTSWTKPEELFPDISQVDETLLSLLPTSYKNKILQLKKDMNISLDKKKDNTIENDEEKNKNIQPLNKCINSAEESEIIVSDSHENSSSVNECRNMDDESVAENHQKKDCSGNVGIDFLNVNNMTRCSETDDSLDNSVSSEKNKNEKYDSESIPFEYLVKCDECGENVSNYEIHMDMHFARNLHKELNSNTNTITVIPKKKEAKPKEKRKKIINPKTSLTNSKKLKSIDAFFRN